MPKNIPYSTKGEFKITAQLLGNGIGELLLYGDISDERWWEDEQCVVPKEVDDEIKKIGNVSQLNVRINSYGGSVFAGSAIATMIDRTKAKGCKVTTYVDGIAASMGSVIAMVGDDIVMAENAMMMIHKPSTVTWGNADEMQKTIEMLNKVEASMIPLYMRHFTGTEDELKQMLANETWLTGKEAKECGLCTVLEGTANIAASAKGFCFNGLNVPIDLLEKVKDKIKPNNKGGENEMFLNEEIQNQIKALIEGGKQAIISKSDDGSFNVNAPIEATADGVTEFLTAEQVKAKAGKDMTADEVLGLFDVIASKDKEIAGLKDKATEYDNIRKEIIDEALKNGVKAKGERFNAERWTKIFASFSISEIKAQSAEWIEDAKIALNAGQRLSAPSAKSGVNLDDNPDNYNV